ncbi:alpha/beta hydrolase family protein [Kiritimatiellaeota bacterium B1221]|nr:alpha/beta hydrolase family protein [Kiritimatiellaeota bacterium B1221]
MALFNSHFFSEALGMQSEANVIVPQAASERQIGVKTAAARKEWPCLWLLHGLSDDHTTWLRRTSVERYAEEAGVAVVMPNVHRSFYCDMAQGGKYWSYLTEELPTLMRSFFPLSEARENNAVAGLSMGGYGATRWLLAKSEAYVAGASLSGVLDICSRMDTAMKEEQSPMAATMQLIFGEQSPAGKAEDLLAQLPLAVQKETVSPLLQICGTEDFLYEDNLTFKKTAEDCGYPLTYRERPGVHEWAFWEEAIQEVLAWLPEQGFGSK